MLATQDGTAVGQSDYQENVGLVDFGSGAGTRVETAPGSGTYVYEGNVTRDIRILDDAVVEPEEQFNVRVASNSNPPAYKFPSDRTTATITITDGDEPMWTVSVDPATIAEDGGSSTVTVRTGGVTFSEARTIVLNFTGSTATVTTDYTVASDMLTLAAGDSLVTTTVTGVDDSLADPGDVIKVAATLDGAQIGEQHTITITDDDEPMWAVSVDPATIAEGGGSSTVTVRTGGVTFSEARTIVLNFTGSTATVTTDYTVASDMLTLAAGDSLVTTTVTGVDDSLADPGDVIKVAATLDGAQIGAQQTITIIDDDAAATGVVLEVSPTEVGESAGATTLMVTGTLNGLAFAQDTTVAVSVSAGTATETTDYTGTTATLTITAGQTSGMATLVLTPVSDDLDEDDETVAVEGTVHGLEVTHATVTITDDDERGVEVTPTTLTLNEGGSGTYTLVLTSQPTASVTVGILVTGDADVTTSPARSLTFTTMDWSTAQTVTVSGAQDADAANDTATVSHTVSGGDYGDNGVKADAVAVTVADGDERGVEVTPYDADPQ